MTTKGSLIRNWEVINFQTLSSKIINDVIVADNKPNFEVEK